MESSYTREQGSAARASPTTSTNATGNRIDGDLARDVDGLECISAEW